MCLVAFLVSYIFIFDFKLHTYSYFSFQALLGGRVDWMFIGSAPISPEVLLFWRVVMGANVRNFLYFTNNVKKHHFPYDLGIFIFYTTRIPKCNHERWKESILTESKIVSFMNNFNVFNICMHENVWVYETQLHYVDPEWIPGVRHFTTVITHVVIVMNNFDMLQIHEGYGQTECTCACTLTLAGDFSPEGHVGAPLPNNIIKVVDVPEMNYFAKDDKGEVSHKKSVRT